MAAPQGSILPALSCDPAHKGVVMLTSWIFLFETLQLINLNHNFSHHMYISSKYRIFLSNRNRYRLL